MDIEFRHFALVHEIARAGSIAKGARTVGLSQPAASHILARLERYVGQPIFIRSRSGVQPTVFGQDLLDKSAHFLPMFADLLDVLASRNADASVGIGFQNLRFGGVPSTATTAVMATLLRDQRPAGLTLRQDLDSVELLALLGGGRLEMAVVTEPAAPDGPDHPPGVSSRQLGTDVWTVSVGQSHRLWDAPGVSLADLKDERWLLCTGLAHSVKTDLLRACSAAGFFPHIAAEVDSSTLAHLVTGGHGVSLDIASALPATANRNIRLSDGPSPVRYLLAWRPQAVTAFEVDTAVHAGALALAHGLDGPASAPEPLPASAVGGGHPAAHNHTSAASIAWRRTARQAG